MLNMSSILDSRMKKRNAVTGKWAIYEHSTALQQIDNNLYSVRFDRDLVQF